MNSGDERLLALRHKIQDPQYMTSAIGEMAMKLAREMYPYFYQSTVRLHEVSDDADGQEFGQARL